MLTIIKEETIGEYKYIHYSNGAVVKKSITSVDGGNMQEEEISLSETEQAILQTAITTEYMAALMEING